VGINLIEEGKRFALAFFCVVAINQICPPEFWQKYDYYLNYSKDYELILSNILS
jgi:hypothetical protein